MKLWTEMQQKIVKKKEENQQKQIHCTVLQRIISNDGHHHVCQRDRRESYTIANFEDQSVCCRYFSIWLMAKKKLIQKIQTKSLRQIFSTSLVDYGQTGNFLKSALSVLIILQVPPKKWAKTIIAIKSSQAKRKKKKWQKSQVILVGLNSIELNWMELNTNNWTSSRQHSDRQTKTQSCNNQRGIVPLAMSWKGSKGLWPTIRTTATSMLSLGNGQSQKNQSVISNLLDYAKSS